MSQSSPITIINNLPPALWLNLLFFQGISSFSQGNWAKLLFSWLSLYLHDPKQSLILNWTVDMHKWSVLLVSGLGLFETPWSLFNSLLEVSGPICTELFSRLLGGFLFWISKYWLKFARKSDRCVYLHVFEFESAVEEIMAVYFPLKVIARISLASGVDLYSQ